MAETRSQRYAREYLARIGIGIAVPTLCPTCGAYFACDCPPPPRKLLRQEKPASNRKSRARYRKGDCFSTLTELVEWIVAGNWTYWTPHATRPLHCGWMLSQRLETLKHLVPHARRAIPPEVHECLTPPPAAAHFTRPAGC